MSEDPIAEAVTEPDTSEPVAAAAEPPSSPPPRRPKRPAAPRRPAQSAAKPGAAKPAAATSEAAAKSAPAPAAAPSRTAAAKPRSTPAKPRAPRKPRAPKPAPPPPRPPVDPVLELEHLTKRYGGVAAVDDVTLTLDPGTFTGIVGPNGAGKTTTLSMITGLLRPTQGTVRIAGVDAWKHPLVAKRQIGVLPDRLHTFDRLTGAQLLYTTAVLHGLDRATARRRSRELAEAFKIEHAMSRLVADYSSGMLKKTALAAALIHAPRLLVLDEPFESVDPVSAMTVVQILKDFAAAAGTVLLSSHSMELVERICDHVAVIVEGRLIAGGTVDEVRGDQSLQQRFIELAGHDIETIADLTWLHRFSG